MRYITITAVLLIAAACFAPKVVDTHKISNVVTARHAELSQL